MHGPIQTEDVTLNGCSTDQLREIDRILTEADRALAPPVAGETAH